MNSAYSALRALAADALQRSDFAAALTWSKRACEMPLAEVSDRLLHLQALFAAKSPSFESWLADLERIALENTPFALDVAKWKMDVLGAEAASRWLERLPPRARAKTLQYARSLPIVMARFNVGGILNRSSIKRCGANASPFALVCSLGLKPGSETSEDPNAPGSWPCRKLKYILRNCLRFSRWQERTSAMCAKSYG